MSNSQKLPLYLKLYQLIKYLYARQHDFPKQYKYTLGQEMVTLAWQCLDLVLETNRLPNQDKQSRICILSGAFDKLKLRLRMSQELSLITEQQFVHIQTHYANEIGVMIGGWQKWSVDFGAKNNAVSSSVT